MGGVPSGRDRASPLGTTLRAWSGSWHANRAQCVAPRWRAGVDKSKCIGVGLALGIVFGVASTVTDWASASASRLALASGLFKDEEGRRLENAPCARNIEAVDCRARWERGLRLSFEKPAESDDR